MKIARALISLPLILGIVCGQRLYAEGTPADTLRPANAAVRKTVVVRCKSGDVAVEIRQHADGAFSGEILDERSGESESTLLQAVDENDFRQRYPELHAGLLLRIFDEEMFSSANRPSRRLITDHEGDRCVSASYAGRSITVRDDRKQWIKLTLRRYWPDGTRIEIFEAPSIRELTRFSPEAANLFSQVYALGEFDNVKITFSPPERFESTLKGKQIAIRRDGNFRLWVKVTETIDGQENVEEFVANSIAQLRRVRPEIAELYEKASVKSETPWKHRISFGFHVDVKPKEDKPFFPESELEVIINRIKNRPTLSLPKPKLGGC
jgi:hypothetical protein